MVIRFLRGWLLVALAGMLWTFGAEAGAAKPEGRVVKVLTYNIAHGAGHDGRLDLDRIAAVIRRSGADVVALQEVDKHWDSRSDFVDQAAVLGEKLNMRVRFAPIYSLDPPEPGKPRREYGLAILSRYPITHFKNHELSRISSVEPEKGVQKLPGFPEAVINLHGRKIHLFNTHLSWLDPGAAAVRGGGNAGDHGFRPPSRRPGRGYERPARRPRDGAVTGRVDGHLRGGGERGRIHLSRSRSGAADRLHLRFAGNSRDWTAVSSRRRGRTITGSFPPVGRLFWREALPRSEPM